LPQTSADCAYAVYATDRLVCDDPTLLVLDRRLVAALADAPTPSNPGPVIEDQEAWFRRSRLCAFRTDHAACVAQAYRERIAVLEALVSPAPSATGWCAPRGSGTMAAMANGAILLSRNGQPLAIATPEDTPWQPFVSYRLSHHTFIFRDSRGAVIARCKPTGRQ
jgi:uncharacterized protein